jgi:hypothetical protein
MKSRALSGQEYLPPEVRHRRCTVIAPPKWLRKQDPVSAGTPKPDNQLAMPLCTNRIGIAQSAEAARLIFHTGKSAECSNNNQNSTPGYLRLLRVGLLTPYCSVLWC